MRKFVRIVKIKSFHRKLLGYSLLLSLVPLILLGAISTYIATQNVQKEVDRNQKIILRQIQYQIDAFMQELEKASLRIAMNPTIEKSLTVGPSMVYLEKTLAMKRTLSKYRSSSKVDYDLSLIYSIFDLVYSNRYGLVKLSEFPYKHLIESVSLKYNETVLIPPETFENQEELLLIRPIPLSTTKAPDGILIMHVDAARLSRFIERINLDSGRKLLIVDDQGRVVMSTDGKGMGSRLIPNTNLYHFWSASDTFQSSISIGRIQYNLSAQTSKFNNWAYIAMTPTKELTQKANHIQQITWILVAIIGMFWILMAVIGSKWMYLPIHRLLTKFLPDINDRRGNSDELIELDSAMHNIVSVNQRLESQINEQFPDLKESLILKLLQGVGGKDIHKKMGQHGFSLLGPWYYVVIVEMDQVDKPQQMYNDEDQFLNLSTFRQVIEETCEESMPCMTVAPLPAQIAIIVECGEVNEDTDREVSRMSAHIHKQVTEVFQFTVTIAISSGRKGYGNINVSYQECLTLLNYRLLLGHNVSISKKDINPSIKLSIRVFANVQKHIVSETVKGDLGSAKAHLSEMVELVPKYVQNTESVLVLFSNLILEMDRKIQELGYELGDFFEDDLYKHLYDITSLKEVEPWFSDVIFPTIKQRLEKLNVSKQKQIVQQALLYVQENYERDISLQQVADQFDYSVSQLSRAFKEETEYNFGDYVIQYRMEKAKEWLIHTDMPIREVAERLRYGTVQSFTRVFKRVMGMPPGQYRKKAR